MSSDEWVLARHGGFTYLGKPKEPADVHVGGHAGVTVWTMRSPFEVVIQQGYAHGQFRSVPTVYLPFGSPFVDELPMPAGCLVLPLSRLPPPERKVYLDQVANLQIVLDKVRSGKIDPRAGDTVGSRIIRPGQG